MDRCSEWQDQERRCGGPYYPNPHDGARRKCAPRDLGTAELGQRSGALGAKPGASPVRFRAGAVHFQNRRCRQGYSQNRSASTGRWAFANCVRKSEAELKRSTFLYCKLHATPICHRKLAIHWRLDHRSAWFEATNKVLPFFGSKARGSVAPLSN